MLYSHLRAFQVLNVSRQIPGCENKIGLSIYLSMYGIYIVPLQSNYSEALPAQARAKIKDLRSL